MNSITAVFVLLFISPLCFVVISLSSVSLFLALSPLCRFLCVALSLTLCLFMSLFSFLPLPLCLFALSPRLSDSVSAPSHLSTARSSNFDRFYPILFFMKFSFLNANLTHTHTHTHTHTTPHSSVASGTVARVAPNRKWFGNTRVIGQDELTKFRDAMTTVANDPYQYVMRQNKLPMSLIKDSTAAGRVHLLDTQVMKR